MVILSSLFVCGRSMKACHSDQLIYAFSIILSLGSSCNLPRARTSSLGFLLSSGCLRLKGDLLGVTLSPSMVVKNLRFWSHYFPASNLSSLNCKFYAAAAAAKSLQSCPTLCDPVDSSPPGSPVPGILQARTLEWVAISFSASSMTLGELLPLFSPHCLTLLPNIVGM